MYWSNATPFWEYRRSQLLMLNVCFQGTAQTCFVGRVAENRFGVGDDSVIAIPAHLIRELVMPPLTCRSRLRLAKAAAACYQIGAASRVQKRIHRLWAWGCK